MTKLYKSSKKVITQEASSKIQQTTIYVWENEENNWIQIHVNGPKVILIYLACIQ